MAKGSGPKQERPKPAEGVWPRIDWQAAADDPVGAFYDVLAPRAARAIDEYAAALPRPLDASLPDAVSFVARRIGIPCAVGVPRSVHGILEHYGKSPGISSGITYFLGRRTVADVQAYFVASEGESPFDLSYDEKRDAPELPKNVFGMSITLFPTDFRADALFGTGREAFDPGFAGGFGARLRVQAEDPEEGSESGFFTAETRARFDAWRDRLGGAIPRLSKGIGVIGVLVPEGQPDDVALLRALNDPFAPLGPRPEGGGDAEAAARKRLAAALRVYFDGLLRRLQTPLLSRGVCSDSYVRMSEANPFTDADLPADGEWIEPRMLYSRFLACGLIRPAAPCGERPPWIDYGQEQDAGMFRVTLAQLRFFTPPDPRTGESRPVAEGKALIRAHAGKTLSASDVFGLPRVMICAALRGKAVPDPRWGPEFCAWAGRVGFWTNSPDAFCDETIRGIVRGIGDQTDGALSFAMDGPDVYVALNEVDLGRRPDAFFAEVNEGRVPKLVATGLNLYLLFLSPRLEKEKPS